MIFSLNHRAHLPQQGSSTEMPASAACCSRRHSSRPAVATITAAPAKSTGRPAEKFFGLPRKSVAADENVLPPLQRQAVITGVRAGGCGCAAADVAVYRRCDDHQGA